MRSGDEKGALCRRTSPSIAPVTKTCGGNASVTRGGSVGGPWDAYVIIYFVGLCVGLGRSPGGVRGGVSGGSKGCIHNHLFRGVTRRSPGRVRGGVRGRVHWMCSRPRRTALQLVLSVGTMLS